MKSKRKLPGSVLVAMSAFKGTLSNEEACGAVSEALASLAIAHQIVPVGDGGRGTLTCIQKQINSEITSLEVSGPLGHPEHAYVLCMPNKENPHTIFLESAECCGHHLVDPENLEPMRASSYGLGELIQKSIQRWKASLKSIYVGLGDSVTSDMGMGMLSALGFKFIDSGGTALWGNAHGMRLARSLQLPKVSQLDTIKFKVLCDVVNPLMGPSGAANTFAKQKGAKGSQIGLINQGMENLAALISDIGGRQVQGEPMTGAAGGLGAAFAAFFNAELVQGSRFLLDWIGFEKFLRGSDLLVTGEGKTDGQTLQGKASMECLNRAAQMGKPSLLISGSLGKGYEPLLKKPHVQGCFASGMDPDPATALTQKTCESIKLLHN